MHITFHGAAGGVTGSKHIIEHEGTRILLDCGFFQGKRSESRKLNSGFDFDPATIDAVVLSHAHLDHCGMLPLLVKHGYKGKIYTTPATKDVTKFMLMDSAHIQESDYKYLKKKKVARHEKLSKPLYTSEDIPPVLRKFVLHEYERNGGGWIDIAPKVRLKFYDAGHILGSAVSVLEFTKGGKKMHVMFTGDLGRKNAPLLYDPRYVKEKVQVVIAESTYGNRVHGNIEEAHQKIIDIVDDVIQKKGKLIIPAFSLGRTQEIVYVLHHLTDTGRIPRLPIYVDSPLATRVTSVFKKYRKDYDVESKLDFPRGGDVPLMFRNLKYTQHVDESKDLNFKKGPFAVISASGMAEGGRVLHHLKNSLRSANNTVLFTGYQAYNTLGRRILEGQSPVRIYGRQYKVNANIAVVNELSAHADSNEMVEYITKPKGLQRVFLVHGETDSAIKLRTKLKKNAAQNFDVTIPVRGQKVKIPF